MAKMCGFPLKKQQNANNLVEWTAVSPYKMNPGSNPWMEIHGILIGFGI